MRTSSFDVQAGCSKFLQNSEVKLFFSNYQAVVKLPGLRQDLPERGIGSPTGLYN